LTIEGAEAFIAYINNEEHPGTGQVTLLATDVSEASEKAVKMPIVVVIPVNLVKYNENPHTINKDSDTRGS
jgi:predicted transcriptional regulator